MSFLFREGKIRILGRRGWLPVKIEGQRSERLRAFNSDLESKLKGNILLSYFAHITNEEAKLVADVRAIVANDLVSCDQLCVI
jgi:hypothetical protein